MPIFSSEFHSINISRIVHVLNPSWIFFRYSNIVEECLDLVRARTHITHTNLLAHLLLSELEEISRLFHHKRHLVSHLISDSDLFSVGHFHRVWSDSLLDEVVGHLLRNLSKDGFGEFNGVRF